MRSLNATCSPCHSPLRFSPRRLDLDADTSFFFSFATYVSCFLGGQFIRMESSRTYSFVSCFNSLLRFWDSPLVMLAPVFCSSSLLCGFPLCGHGTVYRSAVSVTNLVCSCDYSEQPCSERSSHPCSVISLSTVSDSHRQLRSKHVIRRVLGTHRS